MDFAQHIVVSKGTMSCGSGVDLVDANMGLGKTKVSVLIN
jgi:hypothetical protein